LRTAQIKAHESRLRECSRITPEQRQDVSDELEKAWTATETPAAATTTEVAWR
jgi:hypothetical protein